MDRRLRLLEAGQPTGLRFSLPDAAPPVDMSSTDLADELREISLLPRLAKLEDKIEGPAP